MTDTDQMTDEEFDAFMYQYEVELTALARQRLFPTEAQAPHEVNEQRPEDSLAV
jgi:hypothetical protein